MQRKRRDGCCGDLWGPGCHDLGRGEGQRVDGGQGGRGGGHGTAGRGRARQGTAGHRVRQVVQGMTAARGEGHNAYALQPAPCRAVCSAHSCTPIIKNNYYYFGRSRDRHDASYDPPFNLIVTLGSRSAHRIPR